MRELKQKSAVKPNLHNIGTYDGVWYVSGIHLSAKTGHFWNHPTQEKKKKKKTAMAMARKTWSTGGKDGSACSRKKHGDGGFAEKKKGTTHRTL